MKNLTKKAVSLLLMSCLSISISANVLAASSVNDLKNNQPQKLTQAQVVSILENNNVSKEKQQILTEKYKNDELWDCYKDEKLAKVPKEFSYLDINSNIKEKYYRFDDGSFIRIAVEPEPVSANKSIGTNSIISDSYGTLYTNHKISRIVGTTSAWFYANFYVARYGPSRIYTPSNSGGIYNAPFGEGISGFGVTANPTKEMIRDVEETNTSQAALFRLFWFTGMTVSGTWQGIGGSIPIGSTCNLYLALINGQMYIDSALPF